VRWIIKKQKSNDEHYQKALAGGRVPLTGVLAGVAVPCDPFLTAHSEVLLTASETGLDVTLEAISAGRVTGRTATPVYRTGIARLILRSEQRPGASLILTTDGSAGPNIRGLVVIRTFLVGSAAAGDVCWCAQRALAEADGHYAQAQAGCIALGIAARRHRRIDDSVLSIFPERSHDRNGGAERR
jgi:hypothetical protein